MNAPTVLHFEIRELQSGNFLADLRLDPGKLFGEHHAGAAPTPDRAVVLAAVHWVKHHNADVKALIERFDQIEAMADEFGKDVIGVTVDDIKALLRLVRGEPK